MLSQGKFHALPGWEGGGRAVRKSLSISSPSHPPPSPSSSSRHSTVLSSLESAQTNSAKGKPSHQPPLDHNNPAHSGLTLIPSNSTRLALSRPFITPPPSTFLHPTSSFSLAHDFLSPKSTHNFHPSFHNGFDAPFEGFVFTFHL